MAILGAGQAMSDGGGSLFQCGVGFGVLFDLAVNADEGLVERFFFFTSGCCCQYKQEQDER